MYTGSRFPDWQDKYLFIDFCYPRVQLLFQHAEGHWITEDVGVIPFNQVPIFTATIAQDENGEIFIGTFDNTNIIEFIPLSP